MAKKATKKVVAKPTKKPSKAKAPTAAKKAASVKKSSKQTTVSKKLATAKSVKAEVGAAKKVPKAVSTVDTKKAAKQTKSVRPAAGKKSPDKELKTSEKHNEVELESPSESGVISSGKRTKKYEGATEEESKWLELKDKYRNIKPQPYKMSDVYQEKTPLEHKVLGWGFVLSVVNDRLEVLFRSGIKHLISNYKMNT